MLDLQRKMTGEFVSAIYDSDLSAIMGLLNTKDFDPVSDSSWQTENSAALILAAKIGKLEVVDLLLRYEVFDPCAQNCMALFGSLINRHYEITIRLLADTRVKDFLKTADSVQHKSLLTTLAINQKNIITDIINGLSK